MTELLRTKLFIPRPRKEQVHRARLVDRLNSGLDQKLTLIAAPAGFGKTTLLSEWIPQCPRCVTWFSIDEGDNDPSNFWAYFISSIQGLRADLGAGALTLLQSPQASQIPAILTALINDLAAFPDVFAIVLDDYHVIKTQVVHDALGFLIEHSPPNMHVVLTTRIDPPLPLARLRARQHLAELRANELRFSAEETAAFLTQALGQALTSDEVAVLAARTEGWAAGLQIALLSMQGQPDLSGFIRAFSGSHRYILGYLADEVLNQRPKGTLKFLLQTSILDSLCSPLCNALTGDSNGQAMLENLEHANLFITPLDDEGVWYRYHQLFAEVLRARLQQTQPDLIQRLHRRASEWYEENGRLHEAVSHALAARDFDQAARLIEPASRTMWQQGEESTLQNWLAALPAAIRRAHPQLCLAQAWSALAAGNLAAVEAGLLEAEEAFRPAIEADARPLQAQIDALRSTLAGYHQDSAKAIELAHQALENLPEGDHFLRGLLAFNLGRAYLSQGELFAASQKLSEAATFSLKSGDLSTASFALSGLGTELKAQGRLREAAACYRQAIQAIQKDGRPLPVVAASGAYVWLGSILYEWNQLDEATGYANQGLELSHPAQAGGAILVGNLVLANVRRAQSDLEGALDALREAETAVRSDMSLSVTLRMIAAMRAQLSLDQRRLADAVQWASVYERELDFPTRGDWPGVRQFSPVFDYEVLTLVRVRMAQGLLEGALRLLSRLQPVIETGARTGSLIELLALRALALHQATRNADSSAALEQALTLAEPEGYVRTFVDEGDRMRVLLIEFQSMIKSRLRDRIDDQSLRLFAYTGKLLAAFPVPAPAGLPRHEDLLDPLSERELDILKLIASGRTNQEIAETLVIAISTVKSHINNLYGKLSANRRTEAIAIARDLGLLPD